MSRRLWPALAVALALLLPTPAAHAGTAVLTDPRGDAKPRSIDWTRLTVSHDAAQVAAQVDLVDLPRKGMRSRGRWLEYVVGLELRVGGEGPGGTYYVNASRKKKPKTKITLFYEDQQGFSRVSCPSAAVTWKHGRTSAVRFTVPRTCLPQATPVILASASVYYAVEGDLQDYTDQEVVVPLG